MEPVYLGTFTFHIENVKKSKNEKGLRFLNHYLAEQVANEYLSQIVDRLNVNVGQLYGVKFSFKLIGTNHGCLKAIAKLFVKTGQKKSNEGSGVNSGVTKAVTLTAIIAFASKWADIREDIFLLISDSTQAFECIISEQPKQCFTELVTGNLVKHSYFVNEGDTLEEIVRKWDIKGYSIHQVMVATFNQNSHAFIDNNVNKLRIGVLLTSPDEKSLKQVKKDSIYLH